MMAPDAGVDIAPSRFTRVKMDVLKQASEMMTKKLSLSHQIMGKIAMVTPENFQFMCPNTS